MGRKNRQYAVHLYSGGTHHYLAVSQGQMDRLVAAWQTQDEIRLDFRDNSSTFRFRLSRFDAMTYAPVPEEETE